MTEIKEILNRYWDLKEIAEFTFTTLQKHRPDLIKLFNIDHPIELFHATSLANLFELCKYAEQL